MITSGQWICYSALGMVDFCCFLSEWHHEDNISIFRIFLVGRRSCWGQDCDWFCIAWGSSDIGGCLSHMWGKSKETILQVPINRGYGKSSSYITLEQVVFQLLPSLIMCIPVPVLLSVSVTLASSSSFPLLSLSTVAWRSYRRLWQSRGGDKGGASICKAGKIPLSL